MERRPLYLLRQARGLLSLSLILGATWFIGVANTFLQYMPLTFIFTILNSLQGTEYELGHGLLNIWTELLYLTFPHEADILTLIMSHKLTQHL